MGTILFLILRIFKVIDTGVDAVILAALISLDSIALAIFHRSKK